MKKALWILCICAMLFSLASCSIAVPTSTMGEIGELTPSQGLKFTYANGAYSLSGVGSCTDTVIVVPEKFNNRPVKAIADNAFFDNNKIKAVYLPESIESIGESAFHLCTSLETIAFAKDGALKTIGKSAFRSCTALTTVTFPQSLERIGTQAFYWCNSLEGIYFEGNSRLQSIGEGAFYWCTELTRISIPASVTSIEKDAFDQCTRLMGVFIEDTAAWCGIQFANSTSNPVCTGARLYVNGVLAEDIVISEGATSIGKYTFRGLTNLKSITVASTVTSIARGAFSTCEGLESVTFADADGWKCGENDGATRGFSLSATSLANPTTAATFLKDTYSDYYWFK